jgi:hypothetical protein
MNNNRPDPNWKTRAYLMGTAVGTLFGIASAYLYTRAAEEDILDGGNPKRQIQTGDLLGLGLAALAIIRQISELGRSPQGKKR